MIVRYFQNSPVFPAIGGMAIATDIMHGAHALLPYFLGSVVLAVVLTFSSKKWSADLSFLAMATVFGTVSGYTAAQKPELEWAAIFIAIIATPAGPLILTSLRENPAAAVNMIANGIQSVRIAIFGRGGVDTLPPAPPSPPFNDDDIE